MAVGYLNCFIKRVHLIPGFDVSKPIPAKQCALKIASNQPE